MNPQKRSVLLSLTALAIFVATLAYILNESVALESLGISQEDTLASNIGLFALININVVVVMVLVFLVAKNIIKLLLDRRNNILGSRLRTRLVVAFVGLSLIPTVLLLFVAKGILESVLQGWFSPQISAAVDGALGIGRYYYSSAERKLGHQVEYTAKHIAHLYPLIAEEELPSDQQFLNLQTVLEAYLKGKLEEYQFSELAVVDRNGGVIARATNAKLFSDLDEHLPLNLAAVDAAQEGQLIVRPEQSFDVEVLRAYAPLEIGPLYGNNQALLAGAASVGSDSQTRVLPYTVVGSFFIPPRLSRMLSTVLDTFDDYKELRSYRRPLASTYVLALIGFTLMIVFAAVWVGFYLARSLTGPIQALAQGTNEVAHGNLAHQIPEVGDDELSVLVRSFNHMTADLRSITGELVERRRYMETVLAHVGVGVISVGAKGQIVTFNLAAAAILGKQEVSSLVGQDIQQVLPEELVQTMKTALSELELSEDKIFSEDLSLYVKQMSRNIKVTGTRLSGFEGEMVGAVFLIDDLTELVSAQRMAAWREVARRIAHEIKNPLTPIQLSAERLRRKLLLSPSSATTSNEAALVAECTTTISQQVETLRRLVNEFSRFAQMPKSVLAPTELNKIIEEVAQLGQQTYPDISIHVDLDLQLPVLLLDGEQIRRSLVNLVDNAVASVKERIAIISGGESEGKVVISSRLNKKAGVVYLEVADNGIGVRDADKAKVFEPYFTTRKGGTGLGLAIVSAIVADHQGFIRVKDNQPHGACVVMELPATAEVRKAGV